MDICIAYTRENSMWQPYQAGWRTAVDNWGVLHDLMHHFPGDNGTLAQEFATLGSEYYINFEATGRGNKLGKAITFQESLRTLSAGLEGFLGADYTEHEHPPEHFVLPEPPTDYCASKEALRVFEKLAEEAPAILRRFVGSDEDWEEAFASFQAPGRVLGWIVSGYARAKERFPEQVRVQRAWELGLAVLEKLRHTGPEHIVETSITDYDLRIEVFDADGKSLA